MLKIGPYAVSSIETGSFGLDGGAMFSIVPKVIWERNHPPDDKNLIDLRARAMLIQKPAEGDQPALNILVDCGMGTKWSEKFVKMYNVDFTKWSLEEELQKKGLELSDITDVILTHLHFDHAGGMTYKEGDELLPTFPNARVHVQRRNWELAYKPSEKDRASYLKENYDIYSDSGRCGRLLNLIDTPHVEPTGKTAFTGPDPKEEEILPGISVQISNGHTLGLQTVRVSGDKTSITYMADLIPTSTHVRVPFIMSYDCFPMFIMEEKKQVLKRALDEGGYLFYEHCPHMHASKVRMTEKNHFEATEPLAL